MYHLVSRTAGRRLLFRTWKEGARLWHELTARVPGVTALCLMPDHIHLVHHANVRSALGHVLNGHAQRLNRARGWRGQLFAPMPVSSVLTSQDKRARTIRYVHLNPCRPPRLVEDPLAWPFSTYRDAVGLSVDPVRRADPDPLLTHGYTVSDDWVRAGSMLPVAGTGQPPIEAIVQAVSALLRYPVDAVHHRGSLRSLVVHAARDAGHPASAIATALDLSIRTVHRCPPSGSTRSRLVLRVAGDPRFDGLGPGDLLMNQAFRGYRQSGFR